ncbi:MAG: S-layer family protein [Oscillatoriaceae bacterium SKW80]|nr:S-layer family protein [Oscillatoriaceae bacterium SKYG93]MCX8120899.1 S-layer family protein [Oscillatoriaceae bacterium SKW80]MDW8452172.1 filamentous hemagglutinin N-terminal domain-containing protein [Oscillatoriaceae cyanobacterium SKYGB_i_bin93]
MRAQIIPDTTLPVNSQVNLENNQNIITGGTRNGVNLFHSFKEFSLASGNSAYFNNAPDIQNIITRVTGKQISIIDGLIKANGQANLFLINPNGIIFGANASLNIGGSFIASTANSIKFADGNIYSATNPSYPPLLTINSPIGLQFNSNPGKIVVQGNGNNLTIDPNNFYPEITDLYLLNERPVGLEVTPENTLALIGGEILLNGGNLTAPNGRIILSSIGANGEISLIPAQAGWQLLDKKGENFSNIRLTNAASLSTAGEGGGNIQILGRQLTLEKGSAILSATLGEKSGGNIDIRTTDKIELSGANPRELYSLIVTESYPGSKGSAGDINIETKSLRLLEGGLIFSSSFGAGNAGNVNIRASELVEISGTDISGYGGYLGSATPPISSGNAGNLTIETKQLILSDGALVTSGTGGKGTGGSLLVRATELVELSGADKLRSVSTIQTEASQGSTGNAGNLIIETGKLIVRDGALISAGTAGAGNAGTLIVKARDFIEIKGMSSDGKTASALSTSVAPGAIGAGGNLTVETGRLILRDGGVISTASIGMGRAGNLKINATDLVELSGVGNYVDYFNSLVGFTTSPSDLKNGLFTTSFSQADAGNIEINTARLLVNNGAFIITSTVGSGWGGYLTINAWDSVTMDNAGFLVGNRPGSIGGAGNITINTGNLIMRNQATVISGTAGAGAGGNINVNASESVELIGANPFLLLGFPTNTTLNTTTLSSAPAGDIKITTKRLIVRDGATISAGTFGEGKGGTLEVNASESVTVMGMTPNRVFNSRLFTTSERSGAAGDIRIFTRNLRVENTADISVDSKANGSAGNLEIVADSIKLQRGGRLSAAVTTGSQGNIILRSPLVVLRDNSSITTNASSTAIGGNITIDTDILVALKNSDITANAQKNFGGQVKIDAKGIFGAEFRSFESPLTSDITANSALGVEFSGTVEINTPDIQPATGLIELSGNPIDSRTQVIVGCNPSGDNQFIVTGRGGVPVDSVEFLTGKTIWRDFSFPEEKNEYMDEFQGKVYNSQSAQYPLLVEASGIAKSPDGKVILTAIASPYNQSTFKHQQKNCITSPAKKY